MSAGSSGPPPNTTWAISSSATASGICKGKSCIARSRLFKSAIACRSGHTEYLLAADNAV